MSQDRTFTMLIGGVFCIASDGQVIHNDGPVLLSDLDEVEVKAVMAARAKAAAELAQSEMFGDEFNPKPGQ